MCFVRSGQDVPTAADGVDVFRVVLLVARRIEETLQKLLEDREATKLRVFVCVS